MIYVMHFLSKLDNDYFLFRQWDFFVSSKVSRTFTTVYLCTPLRLCSGERIVHCAFPGIFLLFCTIQNCCCFDFFLQSGTLELNGEALKRLEELKISGISDVNSAMDSLKMLRMTDEDDQLADLTAAKLSLVTVVSSGVTEDGLSESNHSDSDSGYDLGGFDGEEDVSLVSSAASLSSRSSVTGGSTESLHLLAIQQQEQAAAAAAAAAHQQQQQLRFAVLSYEQVSRLHDVMNETVHIHGRGNFPTLELRLRDLVTLVRTKLEADGVPVRDMRVNGGVASHVLMASSPSSASGPAAYNDLDLIFGVDLSSARTYDRIKTAVLDALLDFLPAGVSRSRMLSCSLKEAYVSKMVKVISIFVFIS